MGLYICKKLCIKLGHDILVESEKGKYIPVKIKLDTPVSDSLATLSQFGEIFKKIDLTVTQMGKELYSGKIDASPTKGAHDACEYCPYDSVCTYRISEPKTTYEIKNPEVFEILANNTGEGGEI